jgi:putative ABC transport system permease protein
MIKNFLKIAVRNLGKNKAFSFINIFGLAIGLTSFMLIASFVYNELNYDQYPAAAKNIYRVKLSAIGNGDVAVYPNVDVGVGPGIKKAFPEVISFTRLSRSGPVFIQYEARQFKEEHLAYADSNFLRVFSIPLIEGDLSSALTDPNSIVVSKSFANKYFGKEQALGKSLLVGKNVFKITGVFDKIPENSHFHFDAFLSLSTFHISNFTWSNIGYFTYLQLNDHVDPGKLEAKFPQLVAKFVVPEIQHDMGVSLAEAQKSVGTFVFSLEPLRDIHLHSNTKYELEPNGDIHYVYIFAALALFILLLACINFTNLSTASAAKRSREVGIRKVMGSLKKQLIFQFLTESVLLTFLATICAYVFVVLLLPYFNHVSGKNISFSFFLGFNSVSFILLLCILVGVLAGIYPSFFLSSFNTIKVLKGSSSIGTGRNVLRNGLVIFQFFVSITLIIATIIVFQQLHYMQNKKPGYDKEQVLYLPDAYLLGNSQDAFKENLIRDTRVLSASIARSVPGSANMDGTEIFPKNENGNGAEIHTNIYHIDYDFLRTLSIPVAQGRNFSKDFPTDSSAILMNEAAVRQLGWSGVNPLGRSIVRSGQKEYKVVGVVADFHYASLKQKIAPLMMMLGKNYGGLIIKLKTGDIKSYIDDLKKKWNVYHPAGAFTYQFLDENFASLYAAEQRTGQIFSSFTIIAILIASLGLFGLAAFVTEQRTKEIGIRKVLGASIRQLLVLVTKDFLYLVGAAFVLSIPFTWWAMNSWLQDFAYRIKINVWVFPLSGLTAVFIAILTISFRAIKASVANPVSSLKTE